ncbi:MAG: class I SAM-dependent methyltransferase [Gemmobacter sp.]|nr:class I SAM-dependent methyltransferase [Gemmobacter sp.]
MSAILRLFDGLDRCAPGDARALAAVLRGLAPDAVVLDAGCGRGADLPTLLAAVPQGRVVAVDMAAPFIAHVRAAHPQAEAHVGDMLAPPGGPFDLIWSGGAVYGPGVGACLAAWRGALKPGGRVAFTDLCWATPAPSPEARAFWQLDYPAITDVPGLERAIAASGYRVLAGSWMPRAAWGAYYGPLARRMAALAADPDPEMQKVLAAFRAEIALWRAHGGDYGYRLTVVEPLSP